MKSPALICWISLFWLAISSCVKSFVAPAAVVKEKFLVVDGPILLNAETRIHLSRTRPLADSTGSGSPENNALVFIESDAGERFPCVAKGEGVYTFDGPGLHTNERYRLAISTSSGKQYLSDFVEAKETPAIDSVSWTQDDDIDLSVTTHDPAGKARYYRWEYIETYQYRVAYESYADFRNGQLVMIPPEEYKYNCFITDSSSNILLGTSVALADDVIYQAPLLSIPNDNSKTGVRYSILVKQYALAGEAYTYWQIMQQTSQSQGGLFDPQPAQLRGNIHCTTNPEEPVVGFVSVCSVQEQRIFIRWGELVNRIVPDYSQGCRVTFISADEAHEFLSDGARKPAYFVGNGSVVAIAPAACVDCTLRGGTTQIPSFW